MSGLVANLAVFLSCSEPAEKLSGVSEDRIVESISVSDGILHSTVDDVQSLARSVSGVM